MARRAGDLFHMDRDEAGGDEALAEGDRGAGVFGAGFGAGLAGVEVQLDWTLREGEDDGGVEVEVER